MRCRSRYSDKASLRGAVNSFRHPGGNTNTSGGQYVTFTDLFQETAGDRKNVQNIVILITDGKPTRDVPTTFTNADELQKYAKVFVVGITSQVKAETLEKLSSQPRRKGSEYFESAKFEDLKGIVELLLQTTCVITTPAPTGKRTKIHSRYS